MLARALPQPCTCMTQTLNTDLERQTGTMSSRSGWRRNAARRKRLARRTTAARLYQRAALRWLRSASARGTSCSRNLPSIPSPNTCSQFRAHPKHLRMIPRLWGCSPTHHAAIPTLAERHAPTLAFALSVKENSRLTFSTLFSLPRFPRLPPSPTLPLALPFSPAFLIIVSNRLLVVTLGLALRIQVRFLTCWPSS